MPADLAYQGDLGESDWLHFQDNYFSQEWVDLHLPQGQSIRYQRMSIATLVNEVIKAGFRLEQLVEPRPAEAREELNPERCDQLNAKPSLRALRLRRPDKLCMRTDSQTLLMRLQSSPGGVSYRLPGPCHDEVDRMLTVQVLGSVTPEVIAILQPAVGSGPSPQSAAHVVQLLGSGTILTGHCGDRLVAAAGIEVDGTRGRLVAIAVAPADRGRGWGRSLIAAVPSVLAVASLSAETDAEAVGFYRALGFGVVSLGEKYPGVERFDVTLRW